MLELIDDSRKAMKYIANKYNKELKYNSEARFVGLFWDYVIDFDTFSVVTDYYAERCIVKHKEDYSNYILDIMLNNSLPNYIHNLNNIKDRYFIRLLSVIDYLVSLERDIT